MLNVVKICSFGDRNSGGFMLWLYWDCKVVIKKNVVLLIYNVFNVILVLKIKYK